MTITAQMISYPGCRLELADPSKAHDIMLHLLETYDLGVFFDEENRNITGFIENKRRVSDFEMIKILKDLHYNFGLLLEAPQ